MDDGENKQGLNIMPIVTLVAILIILVVLIFLIRGCTKKNNADDNTSMPSCTLVFSRDADKGNVYTNPVEVSIEAKASNNATVVEKNVGIEENGRRNRETYIVSTSGEVTVIGYVEDSKGKTATCTETVEVRIAVPTCELEITEGDVGEKDWYISPVTVEFKDVDVSGDAEIDTKSFEVAKKSGGGTKRSSDESYTIEDDGKYEVTGKVVDSNGNEGTCTLDVNIDTKEPTCKLKKTKEEMSSSSSIDVEIEFDEVKDDVGEVTDKGIGLEENYEKDSFKITRRGIFTVTGYVKDEAGNKGTCSIKVDTKTNTKPLSTPKCSFSVKGERYTDNKNYCGSVTLVLDNKESTNGATITKYGIGTKEEYENYKNKSVEFFNSKDSVVLDPVTTKTSVEYYGIVEDSNGEVETCSISTVLYPECAKKPKCEIYAKSSSNVGSDVVKVVVAFNESGTYAQDGKTITNYGLSLSNNTEFNGKKELAVNKPGKNNVYGFVKDSSGDIGYCGPLEVNISNNANYNLLSSVVHVGDSVNYDAGTWDSSLLVPSTQGTFGGYGAGTSRSKGVLCFEKRVGAKDGWVVLSNNNGVVKITTRGVPECYYHGAGVDGNISVSLINNEANKYLNTNYASSASIMNYEEANTIYNNYLTSTGFTQEMYEKLLFAGDYYYLSTKGSSNGKKLMSVRYDFASKYVINERSGYPQGIRPVVTLKSSLYTIGKVNGAYELVGDGSGDRAFNINNKSLKNDVFNIIDSIDI